MMKEIPQMSRNHFEFIARTLGMALAERGFCRTDVEQLIAAISPRLSLTNERFDREKFVAAVKGWYTQSNNIHDKE